MRYKSMPATPQPPTLSTHTGIFHKNLDNMSKPTLEPPKALKGRSRELWTHYAAELDSRGVFQECDKSALERLVRLEAQAEQLTRQLEVEGAVTQDRDGTTRRNPALMALQSVSKLCDDLKKSLSLGAILRGKVGTPPAKPRGPSILDLRKPVSSWTPPKTGEADG